MPAIVDGKDGGNIANIELGCCIRSRENEIENVERSTSQMGSWRTEHESVTEKWLVAAFWPPQ